VRLSAARLQRFVAVRSIIGKYCAPTEAKICMWSGRRCHPDDVRVCTLTGIPFHVEFAAAGDKPYLQALARLCAVSRHLNCLTLSARSARLQRLTPCLGW
jgi:hypothetical protein